MRLLRLRIKGSPLFEDSCLNLDFFATDRVLPNEDGTVDDVFRLGAGSIYSQNITGISGVNASGKTTCLNLVTFVLNYLADGFSMRAVVPGSQLWLGKVSDTMNIEVVFWSDGSLFLIESELERLRGRDGDVLSLPAAESFAFGEERLWRLRAVRVNRKMISDASRFKENADLIIDRNAEEGLPGSLSEQERKFLDRRRSVVSAVLATPNVQPEYPVGMLPLETMPTPIVQAFDSSVEYLRWDGESQVYHLKFKKEQERILGPSALESTLSQGTICGSELVSHAVSVLRNGSFLIVDEMEENLNRSLVASVIELFSSPVTNPMGAQLVFSTHYPEILDVLQRKDNVFLLVRNDRHETQVVKYSSRVKRIENKKSEVVLSNIIKGTTPRYPDVQAMREYVRERVNV